MPAISKAQRRAMAIAEHHPGKLYARNRGLLGMTKGQLHDFARLPVGGQAATGEKELPATAPRLANKNGGLGAVTRSTSLRVTVSEAESVNGSRTAGRPKRRHAMPPRRKS
jgi:hypothetical protein